MNDKFFSENWAEATAKFDKLATQDFCRRKWFDGDGVRDTYSVPLCQIGYGPHKIVINSGIHGIEGYFGSAAQILFLDKFVDMFLGAKLSSKYTINLIHVINGWGMDHRMREVMDGQHGGLVDLNRNFGVDFSRPNTLPQNPEYMLAHDLLLSKPDAIHKKNAIKEFRKKHLSDGVWAAISNGQYHEPYGLFYGGAREMSENKIALQIYDYIMTPDAQSLVSIGLHTGLGRFNRKTGNATSEILVSHPVAHASSQYFKNVFGSSVPVVCDERAVHGPVLQGDLVDCLESRYKSRDIPIFTADLEIGTGEYPIMSPIYKRMDMGDARYDLLHFGKISPQTFKNLTESWYPSHPAWRKSAMASANVLFKTLIDYMANNR